MSPGIHSIEYKWVTHHRWLSTVNLCWELKYQPIGFLPSSWLLNGYCSPYVTVLSFLLHTYNLYQHFCYFYYVQSALPLPFLIFLFLLSLLLAFLCSSNLPQTTTAKGMKAGSSLARSADLWCWCYSHLHFFCIIASLCLPIPSVRVLGLPFRPRLLFFPRLHYLVLCPLLTCVLSNTSILSVLQLCSCAYKRPVSSRDQRQAFKGDCKKQSINPVIFSPRSTFLINTAVKNQ